MSISNYKSKFTKYIEEGAEKVAKKSEELLEVSKLNIAISSEEKMIAEIYEKIGKKVLKKYKDGKLTDKDLCERCKEIIEIEKDIESLRKKIKKAKSDRFCKYCGEGMEKEDEYCSSCGKKQ